MTKKQSVLYHIRKSETWGFGNSRRVTVNKVLSK